MANGRISLSLSMDKLRRSDILIYSGDSSVNRRLNHWFQTRGGLRIKLRDVSSGSLPVTCEERTETHHRS